jgi:hypothetical protein
LAPLYRATHRRCRGGAAVENLAHSASLHASLPVSPHGGTEHLSCRTPASAQDNEGRTNRSDVGRGCARSDTGWHVGRWPERPLLGCLVRSRRRARCQYRQSRPPWSRRLPACAAKGMAAYSERPVPGISSDPAMDDPAPIPPLCRQPPLRGGTPGVKAHRSRPRCVEGSFSAAARPRASKGSRGRFAV